jgi:transcriptional regulator with GAF, ATPase, and Fis domain
MYWDVCDQVEYGRRRFLVLGERGTGKGVVATVLADLLGKELHTFNCAGCVETLVEGQLFGIEKGTGVQGAEGGTKGFVESADGQVMFLDEFFSAPDVVFPKLLRLMQEGNYRRINQNTEKTLQKDTVIIAASNRFPDGARLREAMRLGEARADLVDRFSTWVEVPPLRDRRDEIPAIANKLLQKIEDDLLARRPEAHAHRRLSLGTLEALRTLEYSWPGNVRELERFLETQARLRRHAPSSEGLEVSVEVLRAAFSRPLQVSPAEAEKTLPALSAWRKDDLRALKRRQLVDYLRGQMIRQGLPSVGERWVADECHKALRAKNPSQRLKTHLDVTCSQLAKEVNAVS